MSNWLSEHDLKNLLRKNTHIYPAEAKLTPSAKDFAARSGMKPAEIGSKLKIVIASDHGGFLLKQHLSAFLRNNGIELEDIGCHSTDSVDYPDYAASAAKKVVSGNFTFGIMIDSLGIASSIAANKIKGARAAYCPSVETAVSARSHNNANILTLGGKMDFKLAENIVEKFIDEPFSGGRHQRRVDKISALER